MNVWKKWLASDYLRSDIIGDKQLEEKFCTIIARIKEESPSSVKWAEHLKISLETPLHSHEPGKNAPAPIIPINCGAKSLEFTDIHPLEIARQLSLIEFRLFEAIKPSELFRCAWAKKNSEQNSPNVLKLTKFFNDVSYWIASEIVTTPTLEKRVEVIVRTIQLGEYMLALNNYNGLMEVYCALNMASIQRLKETWAQVPEMYLLKLKGIAHLFKPSQNYKNYRSIVRDTLPPLIPFQGVYQSDLTMFAETPDKIEKNGNINFEKMTKMGKGHKIVFWITLRNPHSISFDSVQAL